MSLFNNKVESYVGSQRGRLTQPEHITLDSFDFVRFALTDVCGTPRGRVIPKGNLSQFAQNGFGDFTGIQSCT